MGRLGLLLALAVLAATALVPNTTLAWIRAGQPWLSEGINQIEALWPGGDTVHMVAFVLLGVIARTALPAVRAGWIVLGALLFSVLTELLQFYVPGRTPLLADVRDNLLGLLLGLALATIAGWLVRRILLFRR